MKWYDLPGISQINKDLVINEDIIYIDVGHGGSDSGCLFYDGTKEKDYSLKFALAVYNILKPYFKKVYITRTIDKTSELTTRAKAMTELANNNKSVQVYSIHQNAFDKTSNGTEWLLSLSTKPTDTDYIFCEQFLKDYCGTFNLKNRGIVQRKHPTYKNKDFYHLHRTTPKNCKVKYIELFFGDNREDCKKCKTPDYFNKATFFLASYILMRYGVKITKPIDNSITNYTVQAGVFHTKYNAEKLVKQLKSKGFTAIIKSQKQK